MKILAQCSIYVSSETGIWPENKYGLMGGGGGVQVQSRRRKREWHISKLLRKSLSVLACFILAAFWMYYTALVENMPATL
jgi:hypothetical protein